ncbi:D site-binding protein [Rhodococcus hoagii]|nr:D site-binding protein [Prescottella equi]
MDEPEPAGGSQALAGLIDEFGGALIADLKHHYGVDLWDIFVPGSGLSPRKVLNYIRYLPSGGKFDAERRGGQQFYGWDATRYAIAAQVNALRGLAFLYTSAHSKKTVKQPEPYPIPDRPKRNQADTPGSFAAIAKARLAKTKEATKNG